MVGVSPDIVNVWPLANCAVVLVPIEIAPENVFNVLYDTVYVADVSIIADTVILVDDDDTPRLLKIGNGVVLLDPDMTVRVSVLSGYERNT